MMNQLTPEFFSRKLQEIEMEQRLQRMRFDILETRFGAIDSRLEGLETRLSAIERDLRAMDNKLDLILEGLKP